MWVFTLDGFYSAVQYAPDHLLVRCRTAEDARRLSDTVGARVQHTPNHDYAYRLIVSRDDWAGYLTGTTHRVDYPNFKAAVHERLGHQRADTYAVVWLALLALQKGGTQNLG